MFCGALYKAKAFYNVARQVFRSLVWLVFNYVGLKKRLTAAYHLEFFRPFKFLKWHDGAYYFTAQRSGDKIFIKTDLKFGVLANEVLAFEVLSAKTAMSDRLIQPLFFSSAENVVGYKFVELPSLSTYLAWGGGGLEEIDFIVNQLVEFLDVLFKAELVHRDLKLENFFVAPENRLVLFDFSFMASVSADYVFKELNMSVAEDVKILKYMGEGKAVWNEWDDARSVLAIISKIEQVTGFSLERYRGQVERKVGRLVYTLTIPVTTASEG